MNRLEELEDLAEMGVRALDNLLDYQNYPIIAAQNLYNEQENLRLRSN